MAVTAEDLARIRAMALAIRLYGLSRLPGMIDRGEIKFGEGR